MPDHDDAWRAGRLLQWGLQPRQRPAQEPEYRELIDRYIERTEFRELVRHIADGLGLGVLDAGEHGIVLAPAAHSAFALRAADFRPASSSAEDRLLDGLVQIAIAATIFPTSRDLEEETTIARPPVTIDEIEGNLRRLSKRIEEEQRQAPDPEIGDEDRGLYEAWRVYQSRLAAHESAGNRQSRHATRRIIQYALERLGEFGCFVRENRGTHVYYLPTWRYQVLVKEMAALRMYERLRAALEAAAAEGR